MTLSHPPLYIRMSQYFFHGIFLDKFDQPAEVFTEFHCQAGTGVERQPEQYPARRIGDLLRGEIGTVQFIGCFQQVLEFFESGQFIIIVNNPGSTRGIRKFSLEFTYIGYFFLFGYMMVEPYSAAFSVWQINNYVIFGNRNLAVLNIPRMFRAISFTGSTRLMRIVPVRPSMSPRVITRIIFLRFNIVILKIIEIIYYENLKSQNKGGAQSSCPF